MISDPIAYLRRLHRAGGHNDVEQMLRDRDSVIAKYGGVFGEPARLTETDLAGFLLFENNRHWWGLQRRTDALLAQIEVVRELIAELIDADRPIAERIDGLSGPPEFDREVWSPILLLTHPATYGVWNAISESAMRRLGLWPQDTESASEGETYAKMNEMLLLVAAELETDLWTVDALWWGAEKEHDPTRHFVVRSRPAPVRAPRPRTTPRTGLERRSKVRAAQDIETFVCQSCWTTKPTRLASSTPGYCIDCA